MKISVLSLLITLFLSGNIYCQIKKSSDESGKLQFTGNIGAKGKKNYDLSECISTSAMIEGVEFKTESIEKAVESSYVKGTYSFSYYVDDYGESAGEVKFKFEYLIANEEINYRLFDFKHEKSDSNFESIGILPYEWDEKVKASFTKKQYAEIMTDLKLNVVNAIRMINKNCVK